MAKTHVTERLEREVVKRIPVTPPLRTIVDLARTEPERVVKPALRQARLREDELPLLPRTGALGRILNLSAAPTRSDPEDFVLEAGFEHPLVNASYPGST